LAQPKNYQINNKLPLSKLGVAKIFLKKLQKVLDKQKWLWYNKVGSKQYYDPKRKEKENDKTRKV
jgi:hypothetical protein